MIVALPERLVRFGMDTLLHAEDLIPEIPPQFGLKHVRVVRDPRYEAVPAASGSAPARRKSSAASEGMTARAGCRT